MAEAHNHDARLPSVAKSMVVDVDELDAREGIVFVSSAVPFA